MIDRNHLPPRDQAFGAPLHRKELTIEQLEELLAQDDALSERERAEGLGLEPATRRNFEGKLENLRHAEEQRARTNAMSAAEIVASIPRGLG